MPFWIVSNAGPSIYRRSNISFSCWLSLFYFSHQLISGTDCKFGHRGGSMILISCSLVLFNQMTLHSLNSQKFLWDIHRHLCICAVSVCVRVYLHCCIFSKCTALPLSVGVWATKRWHKMKKLIFSMLGGDSFIRSWVCVCLGAFRGGFFWT